jgi:hypothetical protein
MRAQATVYTSISVTPRARDMVRAGTRKLSYVLGRRVGMSEAIGILFGLLDNAEIVAAIQRENER